MRVAHNCFVGSEAVNWLIQRKDDFDLVLKTRDCATKYFDLLLKRGN